MLLYNPVSNANILGLMKTSSTGKLPDILGVCLLSKEIPRMRRILTGRATRLLGILHTKYMVRVQRFGELILFAIVYLPYTSL
jgi:hypothetical protein